MTSLLYPGTFTRKWFHFLLVVAMLLLDCCLIQGTPDSASDKSDASIQVGEITYRPPFSQYGPHIASHLEQVPQISPAEDTELEWGTWYYELGNLYLIVAGKDDLDIELALNAYQQGITLIGQRSIEKDDHVEVDANDLLAELYFQVGEAYYSDKGAGREQNALDNFQKAQELFSELRESKNLDLEDKVDADIGWAASCMRSGMLLIQIPMSLPPGSISDRKRIRQIEATLPYSQSLVDGAIKIFRNALDQQLQGKMNSRLEIQVMLLASLSNAANFAAAAENGAQAKEYYLEAVALCRDELMSHLEPGLARHEHIKLATNFLLGELAETCTRLNQHDEAKSYHQQSMKWRQIHNIPKTSTPPNGGGWFG
jgi:hypothetical protein